MGNMNTSMLVVEMCKIPFVRREVPKALKIQDEVGDPPVILNTMYDRGKGEYNPPFYLSLGINGFCLNNCMMDSKASSNVMSLKVMKQLGLTPTHPHGNIYDIDSRKVKVYGLIQDIEVYLGAFPHIGITMIIVVINVPDAWGILFSIGWLDALGCFLSMDPTHANIPMGDGTFEILYSQHVAKNHVVDPNGPNYYDGYDVGPHIVEYDPSDFPFA
jgi:hypothetical protein